MYCENCGKKINDNDQFCTDCGKKIELESEAIPENHEGLKENIPKKRRLRIVLLVILSLFFISGIIFVYSKWVSMQTTTLVESEETSMVDNTAAVVNIVCDTDNGGSGTIITKEGLILTNEHVVSGAKSCVVTIPNPTTGEVVEIYFAEPIIVSKLSKQYDIAMLEIYDAYTDDDGKTWGTYPATLPYLQLSDYCISSQRRLGEPIKIYGYPVTSQNYNLTVTEGIISNFDSGYILTSAKIDSGNSGGLALNQEGCMVGIPSAVVEGNFQNLGVIISGDILSEFYDKVEAQIDTLNIESNSLPQKEVEKLVVQPTTKVFPTILENEIIKSSDQWVGTFCEKPEDLINFTSLTALGGGRVHLNWDTVSNGQSSYSIFHSTAPTGFTYLTAGGSSGSLDIGGLEVNKKHYFLITIGLLKQGPPTGACAASYSRSVMVN